MPRFLLPLLFAAACTMQPDTPPTGGPQPEPGTSDACGASGYQSLVGRNIAAVTLPADLPQRVVHPGEVVTMEFVAGRLTIMVDDNGTILSLRCG